MNLHMSDDLTALTQIATTGVNAATAIATGLPYGMEPVTGYYPAVVPVASTAQADLPLVPMLLGALAGYYAMDKKALGGIVGAAVGFILGNMIKTPATVSVTTVSP